MSKKKSIVLYTDSFEQWKRLSNEQAGVLIKALLYYCNTGERLADDDTALSMAFSFITSQIDRDSEKWKNSCEKRSQYMKEKWKKLKSTIVDYSPSIDTDTVTDTVTENDTVTVTDTVTDTGINNINVINNKNKSIESVGGQKSTPKPKKEFKRPSLDEVKAYCKERNSSIEPESFFDYYESNGWKVGKNPMKDWKATLRRWERTQFDNKSNNNGSSEPELTKGEDGFYYDKNGDRYI